MVKYISTYINVFLKKEINILDTITLIWQAVVLGIVEGITEFLPVSSTGHMIIAENLMGFQGVHEHYVEMFTYVIQLGAILAVVVLYWGKIKNTLVNFFPSKVGFEKSGFKFWLMVVIACIPGGFFGILLNDISDQYLMTPTVVAIALFFGGIWMIVAENKFRNNNPNMSQNQEINLTYKQAITVGLFQCLAIIPGMSRSASTIIGGWVSGLSTVVAAEFSFFLAIPVMVGMSGLKIIKIGGFGSLVGAEIIALIIGFLVSFVVALFVIRGFIAFLKQKPMRVFAIYRMIFAVIVIIAGALGLFAAI